MLDRYVKFSTHARERLVECQLTLPKAIWYLYQAEPEKLPKPLRKKKSKYHDTALYYRYGTVVFTLLPMIDRDTHEPIYLIVTIYDQMMDV